MSDRRDEHDRILNRMRAEMQTSVQPRQKSDHQLRVEEFMEKAGQEVPSVPTIPSEDWRLLRAKLILEEALETIKALDILILIADEDGNFDELGQCELRDFELVIDEDPNAECNIQEVIDGCCDIAVVTTGTLSAFGISDVGPQRAVDESNLEKFKAPNCPKCNRVGAEGSYYKGVRPGTYFCDHLDCDWEANFQGPYKREDGKWIKPTDWQPPNWEKILAEQGYEEDPGRVTGTGVEPPTGTFIPVVDESKVPVGPGDGLRKRVEADSEYHYTAYQGHLCPKCRTGLSDEAVKRMCLTGNAFRCPECLVHLTAMTELFDRPRVLALRSRS